MWKSVFDTLIKTMTITTFLNNVEKRLTNSSVFSELHFIRCRVRFTMHNYLEKLNNRRTKTFRFHGDGHIIYSDVLFKRQWSTCNISIRKNTESEKKCLRKYLIYYHKSWIENALNIRKDNGVFAVFHWRTIKCERNQNAPQNACNRTAYASRRRRRAAFVWKLAYSKRITVERREHGDGLIVFENVLGVRGYFKDRVVIMTEKRPDRYGTVFGNRVRTAHTENGVPRGRPK